MQYMLKINVMLSEFNHCPPLCPPLAGCATSFQVTVVTSTSWSVIVMAASTNITESGAPMPSPSRCSRCVGSSNDAAACPPNLSLFTSSSSTSSSSLHPVIPSYSRLCQTLANQGWRFLVLHNWDVYRTFVWFCCQKKIKTNIKKREKWSEAPDWCPRGEEELKALIGGRVVMSLILVGKCGATSDQ